MVLRPKFLVQDGPPAERVSKPSGASQTLTTPPTHSNQASQNFMTLSFIHILCTGDVSSKMPASRIWTLSSFWPGAS